MFEASAAPYCTQPQRTVWHADPLTLAAIRAEVSAAEDALKPGAVSETNLDEALPLLTSTVSCGGELKKRMPVLHALCLFGAGVGGHAFIRLPLRHAQSQDGL